MKILNLGLRTLNLGLKEKVHINSSNQVLKFQTGVLAGQMHINSLNLSLNSKPRFENLKPRFKNLNIGLKEKVYINSLWGCLRFVIVVFPEHTHLLFLKFQTEVLAG